MESYKNIEEVISLYNLKVKNVIKKYFHTSNDIDDIEQEVYIKTWKNLSKYKGKAKFWSWLNVITINTCKDYLKSTNKRLIVQDNDDFINNIEDKGLCPTSSAILTERHKTILDAINKLNPKFREVIILHDIDELTYEEISQKIKCPIGTVKSRLFNARKTLREELKDLFT